MGTKHRTKYRVKLLRDFNEPYLPASSSDDNVMVVHKTVDEYTTYSEDVFKRIIAEFIDAPSQKLTETSIRIDFEDTGSKLSSTSIENIKRYYNGRFMLKKAIDADIARVDTRAMKPESPVVLKYNIPFTMNYFSCGDDDAYGKLASSNESFIEIEVSKVHEG